MSLYIQRGARLCACILHKMLVHSTWWWFWSIGKMTMGHDDDGGAMLKGKYHVVPFPTFLRFEIPFEREISSWQYSPVPLKCWHAVFSYFLSKIFTFIMMIVVVWMRHIYPCAFMTWTFTLCSSAYCCLSYSCNPLIWRGRRKNL